MNTAVLIEDEVNARILLSHCLENYCNISIVGAAENVNDGIKIILEKKPNIVFLDISLPDNSGFELIRLLQPVNFEVIFVTAHDQYALQAIKLSAVDYLLKPIDIDELKQAVKKAEERLSYKQSNLNLSILLENIMTEKKRIAIPNGSSYIYENVSDIIRLKAQGRYTEIYTASEKKYTVTRNLGEFDKLLSKYKFLRVHHSHLINPLYILSFEKQNGGYLIMKDKVIIEVSRRNRDTLLDFLKM
jgi:two-component system LytT family response regulator